jgi:hypothetical protein
MLGVVRQSFPQRSPTRDSMLSCVVMKRKGNDTDLSKMPREHALILNDVCKSPIQAKGDIEIRKSFGYLATNGDQSATLHADWTLSNI